MPGKNHKDRGFFIAMLVYRSLSLFQVTLNPKGPNLGPQETQCELLHGVGHTVPINNYYPPRN